MKIANFIQEFIRDEEGVTAVEYGLIAALIAVAIIPAVTFLGNELAIEFRLIANKIAFVVNQAF